MKKLNHFYIFIYLIFLTSCGFAPMLKYEGIKNVNIRKINYTGNKDLIFFLKKELNFFENKKLINGYNLSINIAENITTLKKNAAGVTTEEELKIVLDLKIFNEKDELLNRDLLEEKKAVTVTNDITIDSETKRIERSNILTNLIRQLTFIINARSAQK